MSSSVCVNSGIAESGIRAFDCSQAAERKYEIDSQTQKIAKTLEKIVAKNYKTSNFEVQSLLGASREDNYGTGIAYQGEASRSERRS